MKMMRGIRLELATLVELASAEVSSRDQATGLTTMAYYKHIIGLLWHGSHPHPHPLPPVCWCIARSAGDEAKSCLVSLAVVQQNQ